MPPTTSNNAKWIALILIASLVPRLVMVTVFPTIPISDFFAIRVFAESFQHSLVPDGQWNLMNAGTSFFLSVFFNIFPLDTAVVGRYATAILTGLLPLMPFLIWRNVFSLRVRLAAALLLALWPDQIVFSGVLAQDNWVLLPFVALNCLAVRVLALKTSAYPIAAAVLYAVSVFIRQEMLIVLLPAALIAAIGSHRKLRNLAIGGATALTLLALIAIQRGAATGRYALTTEHGGYGILGSYIPGKTFAWQDPRPYLAAKMPVALDSTYVSNFGQEYLGFALKEAAQRPVFHLVRRTGSTLHSLMYMFHGLSSWSIGQPGTQPPETKPLADTFRTLALFPATAYDVFVHGLFLVCVAMLIRKSHRASLLIAVPLLVTILLKIGIHFVVASQARYFMPVMALEILVIVLALDHFVLRGFSSKVFLRMALVSILVAATLVGVTEGARAFVSNSENYVQESYQFHLVPTGSRMRFVCTMNEGRLVAFDRQSARIALLNDDATPAARAIVDCQLERANEAGEIILTLSQASAGAVLPERVSRSVYLNGQNIYPNDIAGQAVDGPTEISLGFVQPQEDLSFSVLVLPVDSEGIDWDVASLTIFSLGFVP